MGEFSGKTALVTGGGSGIGFAVAQALADAGARVAVVDLDGKAAAECATAIGGNAVGYGVDIRDEAALTATFATIVQDFDGIDIAVNAAGIGMSKPLLEQSHADILRILDVNLASLLTCCKHEALVMKDKGGGVIVNISSTNALQPGDGLSTYCASKAGVSMATRVAAMELAQFNIRVVAVGPALTETPAVARFLDNPSARRAFLDNMPLGRPAQPREIADAVLFLASERAAFITGDTLFVDGGSLTRRYPDIAERLPKPESAS